MGLPREILMERIYNDLDILHEDLGIPVPRVTRDTKLPLTLEIGMNGVKGYSGPGVETDKHKFHIILDTEYPYERPRVVWRSPVFHPNIMTPEEGGVVCVMAIDKWSTESSLTDFLRSIAELVEHPNPRDPLNSATCLAAAEWFLRDQ